MTEDTEEHTDVKGMGTEKDLKVEHTLPDFTPQINGNVQTNHTDNTTIQHKSESSDDDTSDLENGANILSSTDCEQVIMDTVNTTYNSSSSTNNHSNSIDFSDVQGINGTPRPRVEISTIITDSIGSDDEDDSGERTPDSFSNINPLNTFYDPIQMTIIRESYTNMDSSEPSDSSGQESSAEAPSRRPAVFPANATLPDDFLLSAMLSIRTSVLASVNDVQPLLENEDFLTTKKYKISMAGDKKSGVKDFAPSVFYHIRKRLGITTQAYLTSWSDNRLAREKTSGKSESVFVPSPDKKFILKTLTKEESKRLRKLLPSYYNHMITYPDTLLSKIFGLHRVDRKRGQTKTYFAVFNNVFDSTQPIKEIYDLKGSTVGRRATEEMKQKPVVVLKDLDFNRKIRLDADTKAKIFHQIEVDCLFLSNHQLMDYSLLIGVRRTNEGPAKPQLSIPREKKEECMHKVPSLLFFLESAKSPKPPKPKNVEERKVRRKSLTLGRPTFATAEAMKVDTEAADSPNSAGINNADQPTTETSPQAEPDQSQAQPDPSLSPDVPLNPAGETSSQESSPASSSPTNSVSSPSIISSSPEMAMPPIAKPRPSSKRFSLSLLTSPSQIITSSSALNGPDLDHLTKARSSSVSLGFRSAMDSSTHIPFYMRDQGGICSPQIKDPEDKSQHYEVYYIGIIDFLQKYNKKKKLANFAKSLKYDKDQLSTVEPTFYMRRFLKMVEKAVE